MNNTLPFGILGVRVVLQPRPDRLEFSPWLVGKTGVVEDIRYDCFSVQAQVTLDEPVALFKPPLKVIWENTKDMRLKHNPEVFLYDSLFRTEITWLHRNYHSQAEIDSFCVAHRAHHLTPRPYARLLHPAEL